MHFPEQVYDAVNTRIEQEFKSFDPNSNWLPSLVERVNESYLSSEYMESRFPRFRSILLRDGGPLEWPDCPVPDKSWFMVNPLEHVQAAVQELTTLKRTLQQTAQKLGVPWQDLKEDLIGEPYAYMVNGRLETSSNLRNTFYASLLAHYVPLKQATSILDIGGGFACLLARIGQLFPHLNLYFCELPKLCLVATYYLRQRPDLQNPSRRVHVMFPWEYSTFSEKVDVVINTMSFHHMNEANLNYYFSRFRALNVQTVFTINREQALRRGEVASFIPHMERAGYKLNARYSLEPWRTLHVLHIWCKNA